MRASPILATRALLAATALCAVIWPAPLLAHSMPERMEPRVSAVTDKAPDAVRIWFDGELEPAFSKLRVVDTQGRQVSTAPGRLDAANTRLLAAPLQPLAAGTYRVFWRAVARDGHTTEGDYTFTVKP